MASGLLCLIRDDAGLLRSHTVGRRAEHVFNGPHEPFRIAWLHEDRREARVSCVFKLPVRGVTRGRNQWNARSVHAAAKAARDSYRRCRQIGSRMTGSMFRAPSPVHQCRYRLQKQVTVRTQIQRPHFQRVG